MAIQLSTNDFNQLVKILSAQQGWSTEQDRVTFMFYVFAGSPRKEDLLSGFNLNGAPRDVAMRIISQLITFGQVEAGRESLGVLVNRLLPYIGDGDDADFLRRLSQDLTDSVIGNGTSPKPTQVRVFCIQSDACSDDFKRLVLRQNQLQNWFDFGFASWKYWPGRFDVERSLEEQLGGILAGISPTAKVTDTLLQYCDAFQLAMDAYNQAYRVSDPLPDGAINLSITGQYLPGNYYAWNTRGRRGIVIATQTLQHIFADDPHLVMSIILRVMQRMLVYSWHIDGLRTHETTHGCLFDFTRDISELRYLVDAPRLCAICQEHIVTSKGQTYLHSLQSWLTKSFE